MNSRKQFFAYVIPSVFAFALSGIYAIVDGFFVGNRIGNIGLSTINIAYPVTALIQAVGAGIGMGGAIFYAIRKAEKKHEKAKQFIAGTLWLLFLTSIVLSVVLYLFTTPILKAFGAQGIVLSYGERYLHVICIGALFQIVGSGCIPLMRNYGGATYAMISMIAGFLTNIVLDYMFVWVLEWDTLGAGLATIIGQAITMGLAIAYLLIKKQFIFNISKAQFKEVSKKIIVTGIAPFGITLTPNISLILINRFSTMYGGNEAIAIYACISYVISMVYLVLQGVGDGCQPLMSKFYGERNHVALKQTRRLSYCFAVALSLIGWLILFLLRFQIGELLGASDKVNALVAHIFPIFLLALPFIAITRITTANFYATEKNVISYILTYMEPILMCLLLCILPLFGGQYMVWWSCVIAQLSSALLSITLLKYSKHKEQQSMTSTKLN